MKKFISPILGALLLCVNVIVAQEDQLEEKWSSARPDGHAPISVMGDHTHKKGGFMVSYRFMPMWMDGNLSGSNDINNEEIQNKGYLVAPQVMTMNMHMLGAMYAPSDRVTLMVMANYISNLMDLKRLGDDFDFTTKSGGIGDTKLGALINVFNKNRHSIHVNLGLSFPTGNIDEHDDLPLPSGAQERRLAYSMQTGSGTVDPSLGITYTGQTDLLSWGAQIIHKTRLGRNSEDYRFGDKASAVAWGAIKATEDISFSTSLTFMKQADITGLDSEHVMFVNNNLMPLFNTQNSGRSQLDLGLGSNFLFNGGTFKNVRLAAEVQIPLAREVNGVQMKNNLMATFGVQYAFDNHGSH